MFEYWKSRHQIRKQIKAVEERSRRRVGKENADMLAFAVASDRGEVEMLKGTLQRMEYDKLFALAEKYGVEWVYLRPDDLQLNETIQKDVLTAKGKKFIVRAIRDKRFALFNRWAPIAALIISIVALVVTILKK